MTVTVTPTVQADNDPPRVRLNVSSNDGTTSTTVLRRDPNGSNVPVRTTDGGPVALSGGTALLYDYEMPLGAPVSYTTLQDPGTVSAEVTVTADRVWLVHPGVPALSMPVDLRRQSLATEEWAVSQGVFWPMGSEHPVVQTDGVRRAAASSVTVAVESLVDLARLRSLLWDAGTLLLNVPAGLGYGVEPCYVSIGAVRNARVSDIGSDPMRAVELPFQVVGRPVGGSQSEHTYNDLLAFPTLDAIRAAYATYNDVLAGP